MNLSRTSLLLTRPEAASRRFVNEATHTVGQFGDVVIAPLIEIVPLPADLPDITSVDWIFTSAQAVPLVAPTGAAGQAVAWCVGPHTADVARDADFVVRAVAPDADTLLQQMRHSSPQRPVVHAAGRHRRGDLAGALLQSGIEATAVTVYDQRACDMPQAGVRLLSQIGNVLVPLFSPRSARLLGKAATGRRAKITAVAISAATAAEWTPVGREMVFLSRTPDAAGMLAAMVSLFDASGSA